MVRLLACDRCEAIDKSTNMQVEDGQVICRECQTGNKIGLEKYDPEKHPNVENRGEVGFA